MPETFIELVPRSQRTFRRSMEELEASGLPFDGYNVPELVRRGEPCLGPEEILRLRLNGTIAHEKSLVVHLRTRERSVSDTIDLLSLAAASRADCVLLVTGDPVAGQEDEYVHAHEVLKDHQPIPHLRVGIAADVYQPEWGRWPLKLPAIRRGVVDAAFTQPVFDISTFDDIDRHTRDLFLRRAVFVGVTWVTTDRGSRYWHSRNRVPLHHLPRGDCDTDITRESVMRAADVLRTSKQEGYSAYVMPMRGTLEQLERVFSIAENVREV